MKFFFGFLEWEQSDAQVLVRAGKVIHMRFHYRAFVASVAVFLVLGGLFVFSGIGATQTSQCQPIEDRQVCITDFSLAEDRLLVGDQGEFSVTLENNGSEPVTGALVLHTAGPENNTSAYQLTDIELDAGDSQTITRKINATTPGVHGFQMTVVESETRHVFAVSEIKTIEILEEHPTELGGPIDRTEIALGALIAALLGMIFMGYRQFSS